jgi:hypothetical protein
VQDIGQANLDLCGGGNTSGTYNNVVGSEVR